MRKLLTFILILLLVILAITMVVNGIEIGNFKILSIQELKEANLELDDTILEAEKVTTTTYNAELNKLDSKINELQNNKKRYEELVAMTSESNYEIASREQNYKLEYLYYQLGEIAKKNEVNLKIDISLGSSGINNLYDITLISRYEAPYSDESGYVRITDFIYDVENDSTLGFKVEDFSLEPYAAPSKTLTTTEDVVNEDGKISTVTVNKVINQYGLEGRFTAKNISIKDISEMLIKDNGATDTENKDNKLEDKTQQ